jgi:hypothetical protein
VETGLLSPLVLGPRLGHLNHVRITFSNGGGGAKKRPLLVGCTHLPLLRSQTHYPLLRLGLRIRLPWPGENFLLDTRIAQVKLYKQLAGCRAGGLRRGHGPRRHR